MTLRLVALAMVLVLCVPAVVLLMRRGGADGGEPAAATRLDAVWLVVPVILLAVLVGFSIAA